MEIAAGEEFPDKVATLRPPGLLLEPLGWLKDWLAWQIESDPSLLADIFCLGRRRMHLIALAFAYLDGKTPYWSEPANFTQVLFRGSATQILDMTFGHRPRGLKRILDRMPAHVLQPASYRHLIGLLDDHAAAKALAHADRIDDESLKAIVETPVTLRPVILAIDSHAPLNGLAEGLQFLVARGAAPTFEALIADLHSLLQPAQFIAKLKRIVETLPLPEKIPPAQVGYARRLDDPVQIHDLAKRWNNCLEVYLFEIDHGTYAAYFWDDAATPAVCMIRRHGRLGWFFEEAKGPQNDELQPQRLEEIHRTFAAADIPHCSVIAPIESIIECERGTRRRRRPRVGFQPNDVITEDLASNLDAA